MGYAFKSYCHSETSQVEDHIASEAFWLGDQINSVTFNSGQVFDIDGVNADYTYTAPACEFEDNVYPPLLPVDMAYVGMLFGACAAVIIIGSIGNRLINWW